MHQALSSPEQPGRLRREEHGALLQDDVERRACPRTRITYTALRFRSQGDCGMKMFVDARFVDSHTGATFDVYDPASGEKVDSVPMGDKEDGKRAVAVAKRGCAKSSETPTGEHA